MRTYRVLVGVRRGCAPAVLAVAGISISLITVGPAQADPGPGANDIAGLIADVAEANQRLQDLGAAVQTQQESVNKSIVDVQNARDTAATANADVVAAQRAVDDANGAIATAQKRFNAYAVTSYMNGPSKSLLTAGNPDELVAAATASNTVVLTVQRTMADLQRARTELVNKASLARAAQQKADQATADAQRSQDAAVTALTNAQKEFGSQQTQLDQAIADRDAAQVRLTAAQKTWSKSSGQAAPPIANPQAQNPQAAPPGGADWDRNPAANKGTAPPFGAASQWDTTLPMVPSAFVSGDPIAIVNTVLQISSTSAQVTADMGRNFLTQIGILKPTDTGIVAPSTGIPRVYGRRASEYVIARAMKQLGVPYSWGGGNAAGASNGIDSGAGTVGFDCSGLVLHAFAGVGIKLPHYSGSQYDMGRKIPTAQMRRGDVLFWGPGGSQHVAIYLGDGQMIEAPYTGSVVKISPVRTSGMTPHAVRYIEY